VGQFDYGMMTGLNGSAGGAYLENEPRFVCAIAWIPALSTIRAKPAVVNGPPRSLVNTNGDLGSCSRSATLAIHPP
jgi:hypothetical protein